MENGEWSINAELGGSFVFEAMKDRRERGILEAGLVAGCH